MEYNVENLFDCEHDSLKDDLQFTPEGLYEWTFSKYWRKLNAVARGIALASTIGGELVLPDIIGLCEVENDSVVHSLVNRSLLRGAGYEYVMTDSRDVRGIDVALLYQPFSFSLLDSYALRVDTVKNMRPTRDILYVKGMTHMGELNVFVVHSPSRRDGEKVTRPYRRQTMDRLCHSIDSLFAADASAKVLVMGDFNDYSDSPSFIALSKRSLSEVTSPQFVKYPPKVHGTYRFQGEWCSLDHIFISSSMLPFFRQSAVASHPDLVEPDTKYGGLKPFRYFRGPITNGGYSDHLPLIVDFSFTNNR